jgi:hypothetical protein
MHSLSSPVFGSGRFHGRRNRRYFQTEIISHKTGGYDIIHPIMSCFSRKGLLTETAPGVACAIF